VGPRARWIAEEAGASGMPAERILACASNAEAVAALRPMLQPGVSVLIKGSRGMELEQIVAALHRRPEEE